MEREVENKFAVIPELNIATKTSTIDFLTLDAGQVVEFSCKKFCLGAAVSGSFLIEVQNGNNRRVEELVEAHCFSFFEKDFRIICQADDSKIMFAEFGLKYDSEEYGHNSEYDEVIARLKCEKWAIYKTFFPLTSEIEDGSVILSSWLSLLTSVLRNEYQRISKNTFENSNGAVFFGKMPDCDGDFEFCVTDAFLVMTNNKTGEQKTVKFHCDYTFVENIEHPTTEIKMNEGANNFKYAYLKISPKQYFKLWLFPGREANFDFSPSTHSVKFSFSIKTKVPCDINAGISNTTDYEMIYQKISVVSAGEWQDYVISLFKSDQPKKINRYVKAAVKYIDENYKNKITLPTLAEIVHLHPNYLSRIFKEYMGCSISQYVNSKRVFEAKKMLAETNATVENIASATGFYDSHHLQKCFKFITGDTPAEFRKKSKPSV